MGVFISGVGAFVPEQVVSNQELALQVDTTHQWIHEKTGILERRICAEGLATSDLATKAAHHCLANAGKTADDVDVIIVATSSPDQLQPAVACLVQDKLGVAHRHSPAFDVNSVCAGFVYGLSVAQGLLMSDPNTYRNALVIGAETYSRILNWDDRTTCVYFGDGAGAVLLSYSEHRQSRLSFVLGSDGRGSHHIGVAAGGSRVPIDEHVLEQRLNKFHMDGRQVWSFAVERVPVVIRQLLDRHQMTVDDIDLIITHQANLRLIETILGDLGIPMEKTITTVENYGNTAAASIPITLNKAFEEGRLKPGARVVMVGFGGGLSWGATLLEW